MNSPRCQLLRVLAGIVAVFLVSIESPLWWIAVIPWAILCIFGIVATIPAIFVIGIGAGGAQADWMSDAFIIGLVFVGSTVLAIAIAEFLRWRIDRDTGAYQFLGLGGNHTNKLADQGGAGQPATRAEPK